MPRLLLRDTVKLRTGGGKNSNGDPIPTVDVAVRASVIPVSGDTQYSRDASGRTVVYRLVVTDARVESVTKVLIGTQVFTLEGAAMPYKVNGRTHHYEVQISRTVTA